MGYSAIIQFILAAPVAFIDPPRRDLLSKIHSCGGNGEEDACLVLTLL
jgi:hypothetical protein